MAYIVEPLSRQQLRQLVLRIRQIVGFKDIPRFPVISFMEHVMPALFSEFYYEIVPEAELGASKHGDTDVVNRCIRIREDVYTGALGGCGRDRMTIAHEIAHYMLLVVCGVKSLHGHLMGRLYRYVKTRNGRRKRLPENLCVPRT
ncbi:MAG: hypothetical protein LUG13_03110 [Oscillospiraceae bacterium]|nr:hypothetical protein [Oscillospiraceae bacterium]